LVLVGATITDASYGFRVGVAICAVTCVVLSWVVILGAALRRFKALRGKGLNSHEPQGNDIDAILRTMRYGDEDTRG
jgi:hypothetical protein